MVAGSGKKFVPGARPKVMAAGPAGVPGAQPPVMEIGRPAAERMFWRKTAASLKPLARRMVMAAPAIPRIHLPQYKPASLATGTDGPGPTVVRVSPGGEHLGTPAQRLLQPAGFER